MSQADAKETFTLIRKKNSCLTTSCPWKVIPAQYSQFETQGRRKQKNPESPEAQGRKFNAPDPWLSCNFAWGKGCGIPGHTILPTAPQKQFILYLSVLMKWWSSEALRMGYAEYVFKSTQVILTCSQVWRINTLVGPWSSKHQAPKGRRNCISFKTQDSCPNLQKRGRGNGGRLPLTVS